MSGQDPDRVAKRPGAFEGDISDKEPPVPILGLLRSQISGGGSDQSILGIHATKNDLHHNILGLKIPKTDMRTYVERSPQGRHVSNA